MSQNITLEGWIDTGTGRRAKAEVEATVQAGVIVSPGGGSALIVVNNTGADMAQDDLVYVSGVSGGVAEITLADANVDDAPAAYYLPAAILAGATGLAYVSGLSAATLNTNAGNVDDPVYLSETVGDWTLTPPTAATSRVEEVGRVAVKSATIGQILWKTGAGFGSVGTNEVQDRAITLGKTALLARGSIVSGQTAGNIPTALDLSGNGVIPIGDGNDVAAHALTGSVSLTNAGVTALTKGLENEGLLAVGYYYLTGVAQDTEIVTIIARTYQFENGTPSVSDVAVDITGDQTADAACTALAAAINADVNRTVDAVVMAGNADTNAGIMLISHAADGVNFAIATDCANGVVSAAAAVGGAVANNYTVAAGQYTITAADVTQLALVGGNSIVIGGFPSVTPPGIMNVFCTTAAGAIKSLATVEVTQLQPGANFWALALDDPGAVLVATDIVSWTLTLAP